MIKNAKGLAIFTTMRTGLWMSGAGGSGILVGRMPDGSWSPPSGIMLHTAGLGFLVGVDIYDCVVVINTFEALEAFTKIRCTLGSEVSVAAGPVGAGGILDTEIHKRQAPIFTYMKSRGFYAGVQIDGTIVIERTDENARFYGYEYPVKDILAGKVRHPPREIRRLMETIKSAQGDTNFDSSAIPDGPPPGDYVVEDDGHFFGVPEKDDPDPYGVLALEKEGLSLKEAGTHKRASWEQFSFNPSPNSPVHQLYRKSSQESTRTTSASGRSSWRASAFANEVKSPSSLRNSIDRGPPSSRTSFYTDTATQTEPSLDPPRSPTRPGSGALNGLSRHSSRTSFGNGSPMPEVPEHEVLDTSSAEKIEQPSHRRSAYNTPPHTPPPQAHSEEHSGDEHNDDTDDDDVQIVEPATQTVQKMTMQPASPTVVSKAKLVTVPKRGPPPVLPPRNPHRTGPVIIDASPSTPTVEDGLSAADESNDKPADSEVSDKTGHDAVAGAQDQKKSEGVTEDNSRKESIVSDEEDDEMSSRWAKVQKLRETRSEEKQQSQEGQHGEDAPSPLMPGGFQ